MGKIENEMIYLDRFLRESYSLDVVDYYNLGLGYSEQNPSGSEGVAVTYAEPCISVRFYGLHPL